MRKTWIAVALAAAAITTSALPGTAGAVEVTIGTDPDTVLIPLAGGFDVAYRFFTDPVEGGGNICNNLAVDCSVGDGIDQSLPIQKQDVAAGGGFIVTAGPLFDPAQIFTVDFAPDFGADEDTADGVWFYNQAPPFVTAWATKAGNDGYTLHWLVTDGTEADEAAYTGITALPGVRYPWVSIGEIEDGEPNFQALSNITYFDSDEQVPPAETPEPATALLAGLILLGLGVTLRMRGEN